MRNGGTEFSDIGIGYFDLGPFPHTGYRGVLRAAAEWQVGLEPYTTHGVHFCPLVVRFTNRATAN